MNDYTESRIREFVLDDHPCVMAQSVFADDSVTLKSYGSIKEQVTISKLFEDLKGYVDHQDVSSKTFETFIAVFRKDQFLNEMDFEEGLWKLLYDLHKMDDLPWDEKTSSDVTSKHFSYSLHGTSFYIVGLHPMSSRFARKAPYTTIVFNLHHQFEKLREINRYDRVRDLIRRRDRAYQGYINPMMEDFGSSSEAKQYSGRKVDDQWKCPYSFDKS